MGKGNAWFRFWVLGAMLAGLAAALRADASEKRVALVIGNIAYANGSLPNCRNDAEDMSVALRKLGFTVTEELDQDRRQLTEAVRLVAARCDSDTLALVYFSGHGVQVEGKNYLVPVRADIGKESDVEFEAIQARWVLQQLEERKPKAALLILDACRDNPLPASAKSTTKGLIPIKTRKGSLVAFAADEGETASANDGGRDSLYTRELLRNLTTPGLGILEVFLKTRAAVATKSGDRQNPREDNGLVDNLVLLPAGGGNGAVVGTKGFVDLTTEPEGARVFQAGQPTGQVTPARVEVELGAAQRATVRVGVELEGYGAEVRDLMVEAGQAQPLFLRLRPPDASGHRVGETSVNPIDGAEMVWAPAGEFMMGSENGRDDEKPVHKVRLTKGYWLYKTPVTNAQYGKFLEANPQHDKPSLWTNEHFNGSQQPVVAVSWQDAVDYCAWAKAALPTEAQWEYAARGPKGSTYPWGEEPPDASRAVFGQDGGTGRPESVGSRLAGRSWCGALDLAGNVWQWCADGYDPGYYRLGPPADPLGNANASFKVLRGGSWSFAALDLRASIRLRVGPAFRLTGIGFRCARTGS